MKSRATRSIVLSLIAVTTIALSIGYFACPIDITGQISKKDEAEVYSAFFEAWTKNGFTSGHLSMVVTGVSPDDIEEFKECTGISGPWVAVAGKSALQQVAEKLPGVHLIDPKLWTPTDPGDEIRRGEDVDTAVRAGTENGLLSLSEVRFDRRHGVAALKYSFVCGGLCGHGGTVILRKTGGKWIPQNEQCRDWIS